MNGACFNLLYVKNASENNLKGIDVKIPLDQLTVVTGPSGSGKSSLVYDTIYAESQRCFAESFGDMSGIRRLPKPHVTSIENLRPALSVSQLSYNNNPHSTVGTLTDASYLLRSIFATIYYLMNGEVVSDDVFSANSPYGCCRRCKGRGVNHIIDIDKVIPDKSKSLRNGALPVFDTGKDQVETAVLHAFCTAHEIDEDSPFGCLPVLQQKYLLYAEGKESFHVSYKTYNGKRRSRTHPFIGAIKYLTDLLSDISRPSTALKIQKFIGDVQCQECHGSGLGDIGSRFSICGQTIADVESLEISEVRKWTLCVERTFGKNTPSVASLCGKIREKILSLESLSLSYLSFGRLVPTLSGGEFQRVRIACHLSCALVGVIYILDEPCRGLSWLDVPSIITATRGLVKRGNTVIAIEHNERFVQDADKCISLGPQGGVDGGYLTEPNIWPSFHDLIKIFAAERKKFTIREKEVQKCSVVLSGVRYHNLALDEVTVPMMGIVGLTGVSGSGKTSLKTVLEKSITLKHPWNCDACDNRAHVECVEAINQSPIGKSSRSIVASYLSVYDDIRNVFASLDMARRHNITASCFSVNVPGGRCEKCHGVGLVKIDLPFAPNVDLPCESCNGRRFQKEILEITYRGLSIDDVLNKTVAEIQDLFPESKSIRSKIQLLLDLGLGYLKLGQPTSKLSGGESQRLKIAKVLGGTKRRKQVFLLDEPSAGLSALDCMALAKVLFKIVSAGNSILLVENNFDFLRVMSDWVIDLGRYSGNTRRKFVRFGKIKYLKEIKESSWFDYPLLGKKV